MFDEVKGVTLCETVVSQICELIASGQLTPGDKLPPERELAQKMSVSKATLREALKVMELMGLLERKPGSGTFVRASQPELPSAFFALSPMDPIQTAQLVECRQLLEPKLAELAAGRADEEAIAKISAALEEMEADVEAGGRGSEGAYKFDRAIIEAAGNPFMAMFMDSITELLNRSIAERLLIPGRAHEAVLEHRAILEAIKRRDPKGASAAAAKHLQNVERYVVMTKMAMRSDKPEAVQG